MIMSQPAPPPHVFTPTSVRRTDDLGYAVAGQRQSPRGAGGGMSFASGGHEAPSLHVPIPAGVPGGATAGSDGGGQPDQPGGYAELGGMGGSAGRHLSAGQFAGMPGDAPGDALDAGTDTGVSSSLAV